MSESANTVTAPATDSSTPTTPDAGAGNVAVADNAGSALSPHAAKEKARAAIYERAAANKAKERAAELEAKVEAQGAEEGAKADDKTKPKDEPKTEEKTEAKSDEPKASKHVATIARLNTEVRDLKTKLATFEGKPGVETKADYLAKLKADPSLLYKDIDDPELLTKLATARYRDLSPEEQATRAVEEKIAAVEKKLADAEAAKTAAERSATETGVYNSIAQILDKGLEGDVKIDASKWPLCKSATKHGVEDAPRMAMTIMTGLARDLGRVPTEAETAAMAEIAFDQLEKDFSRKAEAFRIDAKSDAPKTNTSERAKTNGPRTLTSRMSSGGRAPTPSPPKSKAELKAASWERLRTQRLRERAAQAAA